MSANLNAGTVHQFLVKAVELNSPIRVRKMIDLGMDVNLIREGEGGHHVVRNASFARTIYLFNDISDTSLNNIAIKTEIRYFNPGEYLIIRNESPNFLFLLLQGQVELMDVKAASNEQENNVRLNACCGALGVLLNENQPYNIRARSNSMVLRLGANDFGIENNIVDGTLPLQFKLIIAVRVGNSDLMMKLVDAGENHLESSEHNQTLLYHAAASGNKECLVYAHQFVKEHMDINTRDTTGSIPIWEALLHGH
ncbi:hypothetical protein ACFE04_010319 [Oxalis oulophora]